MSNQRPRIKFNKDGICGPCQHTENKKLNLIDYKKRHSTLLKLLDKHRSKTNKYDIIVPCSGGKDSTYQTLKVLELGYKPLCVNASTDKLSDLGRYHIDNHKKIGVDFIEVSTTPIIRRKIR
jgi:tRNA(Ile)-lysidine synthase TilS/MesJ